MFRPTDEQTAVIDAFVAGDNLAVRAYAGAGKTSTIIAAIESTLKKYPSKKILVLYFNSAARKEAEKKLAHLPNVKVVTNHTFAFAAVGSKYPKGRVGGRISSKRIAELLNIPQIELSTGPLSSEAVAAIASSTIHKFTQVPDKTITPYHIPFTSIRNFAPDDMDIIRAEIPGIARQMWDDKRNERYGKLPVSHDDYLKMWAISTNPKTGKNSAWFFGRDVLVGDEWQDANELILSVFEKHSRAQRVGIGDPYQKLYEFRGTVDGLEAIAGSKKLHLTQTHRFGGAVVDAANIWLTLLGADLPLVGNPDMSSELVENMTDPDLILNRTNAGVIGSALQMIGLERTFSIGGGTDAIRDLAEAAESLTAGKPTSHPDLIGFNSWPEVIKFANEDPNGTDLKVLVKLVEDHGAGELKRIVSLAKPAGEAQTHISTVHKIKGLEAPNVMLGSDFTGPDEEKKEEPNRSQMMTCYVGVTRAQKTLCEGSASWGRDYLASHASDYESDLTDA